MAASSDVKSVIDKVEELLRAYSNGLLASEKANHNSSLQKYRKYLLMDKEVLRHMSSSRRHHYSKVCTILTDIYVRCGKEVTLLCMLGHSITTLGNFNPSITRDLTTALSKNWQGSSHIDELSFDAGQFFTQPMERIFPPGPRNDADGICTTHVPYDVFVNFLRDHEQQCGQVVSLVCHTNAEPLPYIDIPRNGNPDLIAKMQISVGMAIDLVRYAEGVHFVSGPIGIRSDGNT